MLSRKKERKQRGIKVKNIQQATKSLATYHKTPIFGDKSLTVRINP